MTSSRYKQFIDQITALRKAGLSIQKISAETGIPVETTKRWLIKAGKWEPIQKPFPRTVVDMVAELYQQGLPIAEISSRTGVHPSTVQGICKRQGIRRSRSESQSVRAARDPGIGKMIGRSCAFFSMKMARWIPAGSGYEYLRMEALDNDDDVTFFERCTDRIPYEYEGKRRMYVPDILVVRKNGGVSVEEIKPKVKLNDARNIAKFRAARLFYGKSGTEFVIITEDHIGGAKAIRKLDGTVLSGMPEEERRSRDRASSSKQNAKVTPEIRARYNASRKLAMRQRLIGMTDEERLGYYPCGAKRPAQKVPPDAS